MSTGLIVVGTDTVGFQLTRAFLIGKVILLL